MIRMLCPEPESFSKKGLEFAGQNVDLTATPLTQQQFENLAPDYDVLLVRFNTKVGESILGINSKVKAILSPTTGLDHIDLKATKRHRVKVHHLQGEKRFLKGVSGTAELTIALMLSVLRKVPQSFEAVKSGSWEQGPYRGIEVAGKTLGVVGCGRLGSKVSRVGVALGMDVIAYDPYITRFPSGIKEKKSLAGLLSEADIVTVHLPLLPETRHMIASREITQMKDGVVIVNTSRGSIIATQPLLDGLESGKIAAAALDVLEGEHEIESSGHPLIQYASAHKNLMITPHIGGATFESVEKTDLLILNNYFKWLK